MLLSWQAIAMGWNVGQKLYRDKKLIELLGDRAGQFGQALFGDAYVLEKDLYGGAWSETWLANRQKTKYVIKSLKHEMFNHPENQDILNQHIRYFNEEAKALAKCEHEHIVKIIEKLLLPQENNRPCIVMEYIEGVRLSEWVKKHGQLPPLEALKYIEQIGQALTEMHRQNYLHHDVKPQNIMIRDLKTTSGRCKAVLIDLGVARQFIPEVVCTYSFTPGTTGYCAPELEMARLETAKQLLLNPQIEYRIHIEQSESIDVYSLAATLYHMITGKHPRDIPFNSVPVIPDYIDKSICEAIWAGMAREPKDRPKSIGEWLVMLPLTFRDVWRIEGKVLEFDPNDPDQGTYNLNERKVNIAKVKTPQLLSAKGIDYRELEELLKNKQWYEADQLTDRLMLKASGREKEGWCGIDIYSIKKFPCEDLQTIDRLWVHYSNGLYGFSVQKQIYVECGGKLDFSYPNFKTWNKFCDRIAWKKDGRCVDIDNIYFENNFMCMKGHLPYMDYDLPLDTFGILGFGGFVLLFSHRDL
ncbi:hypothetical protein B9G53_24365 [Pseudanabaena sp. SR411]|uniref:serine/threonine-protein kinase n=1 Tax=Pseudanabaena sp. SR411 TaxID=1980935 RepID=UPI000BD82E72|nr:serine/threonine-protein kinase [Pseudanabaena sp. SR411]OYQ62020.1 hypothetical protein B9G53_24365 [Pseudanabaena sp. SR411]